MAFVESSKLLTSTNVLLLARGNRRELQGHFAALVVKLQE
jgi:hypothetical protein